MVLFLTIGVFAFSSFATYATVRALSGDGGIVYVGNGSTLTLSSGSLSGGSAINGGGAYIASGGTLTMNGGSIFGNTATGNGNNIYNAGTFKMSGGGIASRAERCDENGNPSVVGEYLQFGSYPQTVKSDEVTIDETDVDDNGYYLGSDGFRYLKASARLIYAGTVFNNEIPIKNGQEYYFKIEPIVWRILKEESGIVTLLSEKALNTHCFYSGSDTRTIDGETIYKNNYKYSDIRTWLNSDFYDMAFSSSEKSKIQETTVDNSAKSTGYGTGNNYACDDTIDKVFLLSKEEAGMSKYGFTGVSSNDKAKSKNVTDFALANKADYNQNGLKNNAGIWWLRSPYVAGDGAVYCIETNGSVIAAYQTYEVNKLVVPMIRIAFSEDNSSEGIGIYNTGTMYLSGGSVYNNIYSETPFFTSTSAKITGTISIANNATITVTNYGTTPTYSIVVESMRGAGTILTFQSGSTEPDLSKLNITGFDTETYELITKKDDDGYWTVALEESTNELYFTQDWSTEVASTTYMTTTITPKNLTKIQFVNTVPDGFTQIGKLSTRLPVYQGTTATEIAFVGENIICAGNARSLFSGLSKLTDIKFETFDTSKVNYMSSMFWNCSGLTELDLSVFDTSNTIDMDSMFSGCSSLTNIVNNFDTSRVTDMSYMFYNCKKLASVDVGKFNTTNVTTMRLMFKYCSALTSLDVSKFDTSNVKNMQSMFESCSGLTNLDVSKFNTSQVTEMWYMFADCSSLTSLDVSRFNTSNVTAIKNMFYGCKSLTSLDLSTFNTSNVTSMTQMFYQCSALTSLDIGNFTTSKVTDMSSMFWNCSGLTSVNVDGFDTSKVTNMSSMFYNCTGLTGINVGGFNTSNVTNMSSMFSYCSGLTSLDVSGFNTEKVTDMSYMFRNCTRVTGLDVSGFKTSNVTKMKSMFAYCSAVTSLDVSNFNTENVTDMSVMFGNCAKLKSLDVSGFDTSKVTTMSQMFLSCSISSLNLSGFNTELVTDMYQMFYGCSSLSNIDVSNFNTSKVTNMSYMFYNCSALVTIDLGSFDTLKVGNISRMFYGCRSMTNLDLSKFDLSSIQSASSCTDMLNFGATFGKMNYIELLKTPYNNKYALTITTGSTLYDESGTVVKTVPAGTSSSLIYTSTKPSSFVQGQSTFGGEYDVAVGKLEMVNDNSFEAVLLDSKKRYILKEKKSISEE